MTFGDGCLLGPGVHLYTAAHPTAAARRREGVEIGNDAIVASGAVVVEDVPDESLVACNPARVR